VGCPHGLWGQPLEHSGDRPLLTWVGDTGIEPVTSTVSRPLRRCPDPGNPDLGLPEPCGHRHRYGVRRLRADDGIRTRDPHLGKVMLYQLSHVRMSTC
jgi:hypothetical protein